MIVLKGSREHVEEVLGTLDEAGIRLNLEKCQVGKTETEWPGFQLSKSGIKPVNSKIQAKFEKPNPKNLKELRSFMGGKNQMNRFIPNSPNLSAPLGPLLKKGSTLGLNRNTGTSLSEKKGRSAENN